MEFKSRTKASEETKLGYIGKVNHSSKHNKAYKFNELVYTIYLSPARMSGYEVCPMRTKECTLLCLNESGHNRMDTSNKINDVRIRKTRLFFTDREYFVRWVIAEITYYSKKAAKENKRFSVRLNNTSDLSPELFYINDNGVKRNILEIFPDIQFYDYTKVKNRFKLLDKYPNYDLTFSYSGENMDDCLEVLRNGNRVAMVFNEVPNQYEGYPVINGDEYDMRYLDDKNVIVGLKFKIVRNKTDLTKTKFVIT